MILLRKFNAIRPLGDDVEPQSWRKSVYIFCHVRSSLPPPPLSGIFCSADKIVQPSNIRTTLFQFIAAFREILPVVGVFIRETRTVGLAKPIRERFCRPQPRQPRRRLGLHVIFTAVRENLDAISPLFSARARAKMGGNCDSLCLITP